MKNSDVIHDDKLKDNGRILSAKEVHDLERMSQFRSAFSEDFNAKEGGIMEALKMIGVVFVIAFIMFICLMLQIGPK
jgi:hypothetical protein